MKELDLRIFGREKEKLDLGILFVEVEWLLNDINKPSFISICVICLLFYSCLYIDSGSLMDHLLLFNIISIPPQLFFKYLVNVDVDCRSHYWKRNRLNLEATIGWVCNEIPISYFPWALTQNKRRDNVRLVWCTPYSSHQIEWNNVVELASIRYMVDSRKQHCEAMFCHLRGTINVSFHYTNGIAKLRWCRFWEIYMNNSLLY